MAYDIFISYRRNGGWSTAKHLYDLLIHDGYSVSFDIDTLRNGDFDIELLKRIDECTDFILILNDTAFDRCLDPTFDRKKDWLRNELAYALEKGKNVIPIMLSGFTEFPDNLPDDIARVTRKNGPKYDEYYFDGFYHKLKTRFLDTLTPTDIPQPQINYSKSQLANSGAGALIRIHPDMECRIEKFGEHLGVAAAGQYFPIRLRKGNHVLKFISTQDERDSLTITHKVEDTEMEDFIEVALKSVMDVRIAKGEYEGEMRNGLRWGYGKCVYSDGTIYEGEWENDVRKGKGIFTYVDGSQCEGEFVNDEFNIYINVANFPDDNFRSYLLKQDYGKDGILSAADIKQISILDVNQQAIKDLKGIEYFSELTELYCWVNQLTSLDISKNVALMKLNCNVNQLTSLDVSKNVALTELCCATNQLTSLDVSKNVALTKLYCWKNELTSLDVSRNVALTELYCNENQLTSLDVSKNNKLKSSYIDTNVWIINN